MVCIKQYHNTNSQKDKQLDFLERRKLQGKELAANKTEKVCCRIRGYANIPNRFINSRIFRKMLQRSAHFFLKF